MSALETLSEILRETFDDSALVLTPDLKLQDVANWDSMNHINMVLDVETRFGVGFEVSEIQAIKSIDDLVGLLRNKGVEIEW